MDNTLAAQANRIAELEVERDHWHSHYDAAVRNWNLCLTERDQLQAKVTELEAQLDELAKDYCDLNRVREDDEEQIKALQAQLRDRERL